MSNLLSNKIQWNFAKDSLTTKKIIRLIQSPNKIAVSRKFLSRKVTGNSSLQFFLHFKSKSFGVGCINNPEEKRISFWFCPFSNLITLEQFVNGRLDHSLEMRSTEWVNVLEIKKKKTNLISDPTFAAAILNDGNPVKF